MTEAERKAERKKNKKAARQAAKLDALLERAAMDGSDFHTGVVRSIDNTLRVAVGGAVNEIYGDCLTLMFHHETDTTGAWHYAHLSPARARLVATHLLRHARRLEKSDPSLRCIDTKFEMAR